MDVSWSVSWCLVDDEATSYWNDVFRCYRQSARWVWVDQYFWKSKITSTGRIESYLSGSKVKRTRYAHQVSLASLIHLSILSFQKQGTIKDYATWKVAQRSHSINAEYWFTVMEMEALYFMFIKSVRIGDFDTFLECLKAILPWFFALDHTQYSRWMLVFIQDIFNFREGSQWNI